MLNSIGFLGIENVAMKIFGRKAKIKFIITTSDGCGSLRLG